MKRNIRRHDEETVRKIEDATNIGIWKYNVASNKGFWSEQTYEVFGFDKDTTELEKLHEKVHPDDRERFINAYRNALKTKKGYELEYRLVTAEGKIKRLHEYCQVIVENDEVIALVGTTIDLTNEKEDQEDPNYQHSVLDVSKPLSGCFWSFDFEKNKTIFLSPKIEKISGYKSLGLENAPFAWRSIIYPEDLDLYAERLENLQEGKITPLEYRIIHKDGEVKWIREELAPKYNEEGKLVYLEGVLIDLTREKEILNQIDYLTYYDRLTGLPNRQMFDEKCFEMIQTSEVFSVLFLDLGENGMKRLNNSLGRLAVEEILKACSVRIKENLPGNAFLAKAFGSKFAIIIPEVQDVSEIEKIAEKLIHHLEQPYLIDYHTVYMTICIGIASYPADGKEVEVLFTNADEALTQSKQMSGSNYHLYKPSMNVASYKHFTLEQDLRQAIIKDELIMHYQPKVDAKTGQMVGAEALIRWYHPDWKIVSASEFVPLAEESELIFLMTNWVFHSVCNQIKEWEEAGVRLVPISINISPKLFLNNFWVDDLLKVIEETGINPRFIEVEITESTVIDHEDLLVSAIAKLKSVGIKLALDDFGTGYSSLVYLNKFEVDTIKIDKYFVQNYSTSQSAFIVKALIHLAYELNINVVAEGVETKDQHEFLLQQNCDQIQGYLFNRPVAPEKFFNFLKKPMMGYDEEEEVRNTNRRRFIRVNPPFPLSAEMTVVKFRGEDVQLGKTTIIVEDIGVGGLRFLSHVNMPINPDMILEFETEILGEVLTMRGSVVWKSVEGEFFCHGVQFNMSEQEQQTLTKLLNKLTIQMRNGETPPNCRFVKEGHFLLLNKIKKGSI